MIFTAFRKNNARVDVFYDPIANHYTVKNEEGVLMKNAIGFNDYLEYVINLKSSEWRQVDFNATAKIKYS